MAQSLNLSRKQKAAILLISLPPEIASQVFQSLPPEDVKSLTLEMSNLPQLPPEVKTAVIDEFFQSTEIIGGKVVSSEISRTSQSRLVGGSSLAGSREMGSRASIHGRDSSSGTLDIEKKSQLADGVRTRGEESSLLAARSKPFEFLRKTDPVQIASLFRREHPQTIALILSYLAPNQASGVLGEFGSVQQTEIAKLLAEIGRVSGDVVATVEDILESRLSSLLDGGEHKTDGKEVLVEILNRADRATEQKILAGLTKRDPRLATQLKHQLCEFNDLSALDEQAIQHVLRITDIRDLVLSLKGATKEIADKVYSCMTQDAARALKDDVENLEHAEWNDIKAAQQQIRNNLRGLITIGKIKLG